jgi:hypothetical protein
VAEENENLEVQEDQQSVERPDWLPSNFQSGEDLAKSYAEAQRKLTEVSQEKSAYEQELQNLYQAQQSQAPQVDYSGETERLEQAFEENPLATMAWLAQQAAAQAVQQQGAQFQPLQQNQYELFAATVDQAMAREHEDWETVKPQVTQLLTEDPDFLSENAVQSLQGAQRALERAYKVVKADATISQGETLAAEQQAALQSMKQGAQTMTGAGGRPPEASDDEAFFQRIKNADSGGAQSLTR